MIRKLATALAVVIVAALLGLGSAWWVLRYWPGAGFIAGGAWRTSTVAGSADAGMYTRARVAITGLFALNKSEAIYLEAARDDAGQPLRAQCSYIVAGQTFDARWWSITAYADDHFLIPNAAQRFSFNMGNLKVDGEGRFRFKTLPNDEGGDIPYVLPTGKGNGGFQLVLRLYNPSPAVVAGLHALRLPSINTVGRCVL